MPASGGGGKSGETLVKGTTLQFCKMNKPIEKMYSVITIVNNPASNTGDTLRVDFKWLITQKRITNEGMICHM